MGIIIRFKASWINEGEKPTQYILNLENRHFTNINTQTHKRR